jgi:type III secretion system FlhB-like substrate exporter
MSLRAPRPARTRQRCRPPLWYSSSGAVHRVVGRQGAGADKVRLRLVEMALADVGRPEAGRVEVIYRRATHRVFVFGRRRLELTQAHVELGEFIVVVAFAGGQFHGPLVVSAGLLDVADQPVHIAQAARVPVPRRVALQRLLHGVNGGADAAEVEVELSQAKVGLGVAGMDLEGLAVRLVGLARHLGFEVGVAKLDARVSVVSVKFGRLLIVGDGVFEDAFFGQEIGSPNSCGGDSALARRVA